LQSLGESVTQAKLAHNYYLGNDMVPVVLLSSQGSLIVQSNKSFRKMDMNSFSKPNGSGMFLG
jgi:hypothetical protein